MPVISVGALQPSSLPAVSFVLNFTSHANRCQIRGETAPKPGVLAWGLLRPRVCESRSVSRADMPGSTLLTMENICTEHLKMLGCITHTSGTPVWCVCHRVPTAGHWFSARRTCLSLRTIGNVCRFCGCHGVEGGLLASCGDRPRCCYKHPQAQDLPPAKHCLAPRSAVLGESSARCWDS